MPRISRDTLEKHPEPENGLVGVGRDPRLRAVLELTKLNEDELRIHIQTDKLPVPVMDLAINEWLESEHGQ